MVGTWLKCPQFRVLTMLQRVFHSPSFSPPRAETTGTEGELGRAIRGLLEAPIKRLLSTVKTVPVPEHRILGFTFQSPTSLALPQFLSHSDVSFSCTCHPSGSRLVKKQWRFNNPLRISRTGKPSVPGRILLVISDLVVVNQPSGGLRCGQ